MKKRNKKIIAALSAIFGLLVIGALCWSFVLCYRTLHPPRLTDLSWLTRQYPHTTEWLDSIRSNGLLHDIVRLNADGERLHARWLWAPEPTEKTAVLFHGYQGSAETMLMIGYLFNHDFGFNVLIPDLRGHGQSEPSAISMGWTERTEVVDWIRTADSLFGGNTQMVVHGISMGAATTMMVAGEPQRPYVKCFVEDCGYTSVWDEFSNELKTSFGLPAFPLMYTASWLCDLKYGWNFREASALAQVAKCELPMLFIHGDADDYVPTWMVYPLYEAKPGEKELWLVPGAGHAYSYRDNREEYTAVVRAFVGKYVR